MKSLGDRIIGLMASDVQLSGKRGFDEKYSTAEAISAIDACCATKILTIKLG